MEDAQFYEELYNIVKKHGDGGYEEFISAKSSYPYLYHLSEVRQNLVDWIPMDETMHVLEYNAECGALTGKLLQKAGKVACVTEDEQRAKIIRARYAAETEKLKVFAETEYDVKEVKAEYDVILIVGSFYRYKNKLNELRQRLNAKGRLIIADVNRLGLKYFAGNAEEYTGTYFEGIEGYGEVPESETIPRSYARGEYQKILSKAGFKELHFYYPYPDYKFPNCIYSDAWLPKEGELADNRRNFDRDRLQLFDERKAYDTVLEEGLFPIFSNSYLIEAFV